MSITRFLIIASVLMFLSACDSSSGPPPNDWDKLTWDKGNWG